MPEWWSWALTGLSVVGFYLCAEEPLWGWALSFCTEALWVAYGFRTHQFGFVVGGAVFGWVFARNWVVTREGAKEVKAARKKLFGG